MELPPTIPELGRQLRSWARVRWLYPEELYLLLVYPANELGLEPRNFYAPSGMKILINLLTCFFNVL